MLNRLKKYELMEGKKMYSEIINQINTYEKVTIEQCGSWLWVYGEGTKEIRLKLRELGLFWSSQKGKWYKRPDNDKKKFKGRAIPQEEVRAKYGSRIYNAS